MSIAEQKFENLKSISESELPNKEDVELIASSVGVCVSAFSLEPFREPWSINGQEVPSLLLNPKTAGELIKKIFNPEISVINRNSIFDEEVKVAKDIVLEHIDRTLNDSMTNYLLEMGWFSKKDILELRKIRKNLLESKDDYCIVSFVYPLTMLFNTYLEASKSPRSLLLLGYQEGKVFNEDSEVKLVEVDSKTVIPKNIYPRVIGRFLSANHPDVDGGLDAGELAVKETKYYLNREEQTELRDVVDPDLYTIFLGEIAKIPDSGKNLDAMHLAGAKYMEILMKPSETKTNLNFLDYIPKQVLYMSLPGTAVTSESKVYKGNSRLYQSLSFFWKQYDLDYEEKIFTFSKPDGQTVLFGIIKEI